MVYLVFGKILNLLWQKWYAIGRNFIVVNGQTLNHSGSNLFKLLFQLRELCSLPCLTTYPSTVFQSGQINFQSLCYNSFCTLKTHITFHFFNLFKWRPLSACRRYLHNKWFGEIFFLKCWRLSAIFKKWAYPGLFLFIFVLFQHKFYRKTVCVSGIRTQIVWVEGGHSDHLTTTTAHSAIFVWSVNIIKMVRFKPPT